MSDDFKMMFAYVLKMIFDYEFEYEVVYEFDYEVYYNNAMFDNAMMFMINI
jgi:hypothetical protein